MTASTLIPSTPSSNQKASTSSAPLSKFPMPILSQSDGCELFELSVSTACLLSTRLTCKCVLTEYVEYYNSRRPHQGLNQQSPIPLPHRKHLALFTIGEYSVASSTTTSGFRKRWSFQQIKQSLHKFPQQKTQMCNLGSFGSPLTSYSVIRCQSKTGSYPNVGRSS